MKTEQEKLLDMISCNSSLNDIQLYTKKVIEMRGFDDETPNKIMLLMMEEIGELAKALRKKLGYKVDVNRANKYKEVTDEIADVFIYILSLCNALDISLLQALIGKEKENINRNWNQINNQLLNNLS